MGQATSSLANRVGLGVDLENGDEVLGTLRAILETEREIVRVGGRSSSSTSTSSQGRSTTTASPANAKQQALAALGADNASLAEAVANKQAARQKDVQNQKRADGETLASKRQFNSMFTASDKEATERQRAENRNREAESKRHAAEMARIAEAARAKSVYEPPMGGVAAQVQGQYPGQYVLGIRAMEAEREKMARYEAKYGKGYIPEGGFIGAQEQGIGARAAAEVARLKAEAEARAEEAVRRREIRTGLRTRTQPEGFTEEEDAHTRQLLARLERARQLPARRAAQSTELNQGLDRLLAQQAERERANAPVVEPEPSSRRRIVDSPARRARLEESRRQVQEAQFEAQFGGARVTLDKARDKAAQLQKDFDKISLRHAGTDVGNEAARMSKYLQDTRNRAEAFRKEISAPANMHRTAEAVEKDLAQVDRRIAATTERLRIMQNRAGQEAGEFTPSFGGGKFGGDNPFGALQTAQRIGRNLLIYAAVRGFTTDLREFVTTSVQAAQAAEETQRQLEFTSRAAHQSFEGNLEVSDRIRKELFLSRRLSDETVAEAAQVTGEFNRPGQTEALTKAVADINAKRGRGVENIGQNLRSISVGGRGFQELFGVRPAELYQQEAERRVQANEGAGLPYRDASNRSLLSHAEAVQKVVAALSDEEKGQLRINAVLQEGARARGAAAARARTEAGQIEIMAQKWEDAKVAVGNFVLSLTPALSLLTRISGALTGIDPSRNRLLGTGQGGQITSADIARDAQGYPQSFQYKANRFLSEQGPALLGGLGLAGAGLFFGRGAARQERQQSAFRQTYQEAVDFGLTPEQARAEAQTVANQVKPGILRSIGTGLRNISQGITASTLELTATVARTVGLEGVAARAGAAAARVRTGVQGVDEALVARTNRYSARLGTVGGIVGGVAGAQIGAMIAEKLNVGPITATLLTVTGGIVGTAVGTAIGQAGGSALASYGGVGAFLASPAGIAVMTAVAGGAIINRVAAGNYEYAARQEAISVRTNQGLIEQKAQLDAARQEGRTYFRERGIGGVDPRTGQFTVDKGADLTRRYTKDEVERIVAQGGNRGRFEEVLETKDMTDARVQSETNARTAAEREAKDTAEFSDRIRADEEKKRQEQVRRQEAGLAKLRDYVQQSYTLIENVAGQLETDNPFVKVFADGATAAERMKQQWGFLGDATVKYFTDLEQHNVALRTLTLQFESQATSMRSLAEANKLVRERGVGLTGNESRLAEAYKASVQAAVENPELYDQARRLRGQYVGGPDDQLREQFSNLQRNRNIFAYQSVGLGREAQDAIESTIDSALIQLSQKAGNRIFGPGLQGLRVESADAYDRSAARNDRAVERAVQRVRIGAAAQQDVDRMITAQEGLARQAAMSGKVSQADAQRFLDRAIIDITGSIDPKELTNRSYQGRIDALRRNAEREANKDAAAALAIKTAEKQRADQIAEIKGLRQDLTTGKASVLVQVLNDTEARTDTEALQDANADKPGTIGYPKPKSSMGRYK